MEVTVMKLLKINEEFGLMEIEGQPMCSSRQVAETFGRRHDDVLRSIRKLDCSDSFRLRNFTESSYINSQKKKQPEFLMTKDGFTFLAMGFTGKKVAEFKEAYIERFNRMESFIKDLIGARLEHPEFTDAIQAINKAPKSYHYSNESDMINRIVLGMTAKQVREIHGIPKGQSIRPCLTDDQIKWIRILQTMDITAMRFGMDYETRKAHLISYFQKQNVLAIEA